MNLTLADDRPAVPPADLILRIATAFGANDNEAAQHAFDLGGFQHLQSFERALATVGRTFADFIRMLDFGCGCGRFLRHLGPVADRVDVYGTDIDAEMIEWCQANIAFGQFALAPHEPPLPYPDGCFDLVLNHSVFTHLDERLQDLWLAELQRITIPGAILLLTVEGTATWNRTRDRSNRVGESTERWRDELESRGILFIADDHFVGSTHPDFYHSTIHAPWYVFDHWTRFFDIAAYLPEGSDTQDLIVLRRRPDGATQPLPIGRRATGDTVQPVPPRPALASALERLRMVARGRLGSHGGLDPDATTRELKMLRAGLYEQGNRISVLATELRREIDALRNGGPQLTEVTDDHVVMERRDRADQTDRG